MARNQVEIAGTERRIAKKDDTILPGQRASTQPQSSAEIVYADGTRLSLGENSELSLYGVAAQPLPGKKGRPGNFKPGFTTLLRGEVLLIVPSNGLAAGAAATRPAAGAQAKAMKTPPPSQPNTAIVGLPLGKVVAAPGSEVRITVEPTGLTRVAVYAGHAQLLGRGRPIPLMAGTSSRIDGAKAQPKPAQPLPPPPEILGVQQLSFSAGDPVEVPGSYQPAPGAPPPASWRVQVARDPAFDSLVSDIRVAAPETRLLSKPIAPGDYYVRVSAILAEGAEGKASAPVRVRVARVSALPGAEGRRAAVAIQGKDLYCSLDGGPLSPVVEPLPLAPAHDHLLRCATNPASPSPQESAEQKISASQSGPLLARLEPGAVSFTPADPKRQTAATGQRQVTLVLSDANGAPLSGATVRAESADGAKVSSVKESPTPGHYVATVTWPAGQSGHVLHYTINEVESYEGRLPDALPPASAAPAVSEPGSGADRPPAKRFALELGLFPSAGIDVSRLSFNVGAGFELGGRIRLPYGALAFALRPQYEYYPVSPSVSHVIDVGLPISYRIRKAIDDDIVPYIGVLPQFVADYSYLAGDGEWRTAFGLGGLLGCEFRVKHGAIFVEGGYRHVLLRSAPDYYPSLSSAFANLGFRLTF